MARARQIVIILSDTLQALGLQSILHDYFHPVDISFYSSYSGFSEMESDSFDYYFTDSETFLLHAEYFLPRKAKTAVVCYRVNDLLPGSAPVYLRITDSQEILIEQIQQLFTAETGTGLNGENSKELSSREVDVLQQIVKGSTNKEIADQLNISLNTVLTHRKNITSKLGIKTVSGLTFYAIMNGIISGDEIHL